MMHVGLNEDRRRGRKKTCFILPKMLECDMPKKSSIKVELNTFRQLQRIDQAARNLYDLLEEDVNAARALKLALSTETVQALNKLSKALFNGTTATEMKSNVPTIDLIDRINEV